MARTKTTANGLDGRVQPYVVPSNIQNPELLARGRRKIMESAIELFSKKGFHETSVDEIAAASDLTVGALYKYIRSKHDILYLASMFQTEEVMETLERWTRAELDPLTALTGAIDEFLRITDSRHKVVRINYRHNHVLDSTARQYLFEMERQLRQMFLTLLEAASPESVIEDRRKLLTVVADNLVVLAHQWSVNYRLYSEYLDLDDFIRMQTRVVLAAIGCKPAA